MCAAPREGHTMELAREPSMGQASGGTLTTATQISTFSVMCTSMWVPHPDVDDDAQAIIPERIIIIHK